jgi:hypothetical protein
MNKYFRHLLNIGLIFFFINAYGQDKSNNGLILRLIKKDTVVVEIINPAQFFKKLNYRYDKDTLIIVAKTGLFGHKIPTNKIPLLPNVNFIRLNNTKFMIKFDLKYGNRVLDKNYNLIDIFQ